VLRDVPSAVTVSVSSTAYEAIKKECLRFASRRGIETGGYLAGHALRSWDRSADVCDATGPGPETEHGVGSVTLDRAPAEGLPRTFAWSGEDIAEAGFWHTHPGSTTKPSPEDLASWGHGLERVSAARGSGAYLGLIVTPSQSVAGTTRGCTPT
jgi:proteasome lid subunit RPN8/RPN11